MTEYEPDVTGFGDEVETAMRAMARKDRRGHTIIDYNLIAQLIGLPDGTVITGMFTDHRIEGLIITIVSDDLPEIPLTEQSPLIPFVGAVRLLPAPKPTPGEPEVLADPDSDDVMYARLDFTFPDKESTPA